MPRLLSARDTPTPSRRSLPSRHRVPGLAVAVAAALVAVTPATARGQSADVGDVLDDYIRSLQVAGLFKGGSFFLRPLQVAQVPDSVGPWAEHLRATRAGNLNALASLDAARLRVSANTTHPFGRNDDAMWQGKGLNVALDAGVTMKWSGLTVRVHPTFVFAQNAAYDLAPVARADASEYEYPWRRIDVPQRFGEGAYYRVDPGQSSVSLTVGGARVAVGTENLWWGPGIHTSILMSNNASGFPHLSLGTSRAIDIGIGKMETQWIWGTPQGSDWFGGTEPEEARFFTGAVASFTPSWSFFSGLTVGAARAFIRHVPPDGLRAGDIFAVLEALTKEEYQTVTGYQDDADQLASFLFRWVLPSSGFEIYGEWARNDHGILPIDILLVPQHSQGYTLGFQKAQAISGGRLVVLNGELTHLERANTAQRWSHPVYYAHGDIPRGYTSRGEVFGSALGPGGAGLRLGADLYHASGRWGLFAERQVHDNDAFYVLSRQDTTLGPDVSLRAGGRATFLKKDLEVDLLVAVTGEADRYFIRHNTVWNGHAGVTVRWRRRRKGPGRRASWTGSRRTSAGRPT